MQNIKGKIPQESREFLARSLASTNLQLDWKATYKLSNRQAESEVSDITVRQESTKLVLKGKIRGPLSEKVTALSLLLNGQKVMTATVDLTPIGDEHYHSIILEVDFSEVDQLNDGTRLFLKDTHQIIPLPLGDDGRWLNDWTPDDALYYGVIDPYVVITRPGEYYTPRNDNVTILEPLVSSDINLGADEKEFTTNLLVEGTKFTHNRWYKVTHKPQVPKSRLEVISPTQASTVKQLPNGQYLICIRRGDRLVEKS